MSIISPYPTPHNTYMVGQEVAFDADAASFITTNESVGGVLDDPTKSAFNELVLDFKGLGPLNAVNVWDKIIDFAPIIGGPDVDALFLKAKSLQSGTQFGTVTCFDKKYKGNGVDGYINWMQKPVGIYGSNPNVGMAKQVLTNPTNDTVNFNVGLSGSNSLADGFQTYQNAMLFFNGSANGPSTGAAGNYSALWAHNRESNTHVQRFKNVTDLGDSADNFVGHETDNDFITGAGKYGISTYGHTDSELAFIIWYQNATRAQVLIIQSCIISFNTKISR